MPNPNGYATDRAFHARFESGFISAQVKLPDVLAKLDTNARVLVESHCSRRSTPTALDQRPEVVVAEGPPVFRIPPESPDDVRRLTDQARRVRRARHSPRVDFAHGPFIVSALQCTLVERHSVWIEAFVPRAHIAGRWSWNRQVFSAAHCLGWSASRRGSRSSVGQVSTGAKPALAVREC